LLLPGLAPGFTHWYFPKPPDDVRKKFVGALPSPATLPLVKRLAVLPEMTLFMVGVPIKCGLAARARGDTVIPNAIIMAPNIVMIFFV
jgi:hypothetical protein